MYFDQAQLGMSREYLIKGIDDEDVKHYFNFMQKVIFLHFQLYNYLIIKYLTNW